MKKWTASLLRIVLNFVHSKLSIKEINGNFRAKHNKQPMKIFFVQDSYKPCPFQLSIRN